VIPDAQLGAKVNGTRRGRRTLVDRRARKDRSEKFAKLASVALKPFLPLFSRKTAAQA